MLKKLTSHMNNKQGSMYIEILIIMIVIFIIAGVSTQMVSAVQQKIWLNRTTEKVIQNASINGEITTDAKALLDEIKAKYPDVTITWDTTFIDGTEKVQLGDFINLNVSTKLTLFQIGKLNSIDVDMTSKGVGTSEVYWKG